MDHWTQTVSTTVRLIIELEKIGNSSPHFSHGCLDSGQLLTRKKAVKTWYFLLLNQKAAYLVGLGISNNGNIIFAVKFQTQLCLKGCIFFREWQRPVMGHTCWFLWGLWFLGRSVNRLVYFCTITTGGILLGLLLGLICESLTIFSFA